MDLLLQFRLFLLQLGQTVGVGLYLGFGSFGLFQFGGVLFRLSHQHTHLLGQLVALGAQLAGFGNGGAVFCVQSNYFVYQRKFEFLKFLFDVFFDHVRIFADKFHIQHIVTPRKMFFGFSQPAVLLRASRIRSYAARGVSYISPSSVSLGSAR